MVLFQAGVEEGASELGRGASDQDGVVSFDYDVPADEKAILYATAEGSAQSGALAEAATPVLLSVVMRPDPALRSIGLLKR